MKTYFLITMLSLAFFEATAFAEIKLFLRPNVSVVNNITLNDIATIETSQADPDNIKKIVIENPLFSDGYIDKKEITTLLKKNTNEDFVIYGNAVKIQENSLVDEFEISLRKGDYIDIVVKKNGISILLKGTALDEGKLNEEISIRLDNKHGSVSKLVRGRIKAKDLVEINL